MMPELIRKSNLLTSGIIRKHGKILSNRGLKWTTVFDNAKKLMNAGLVKKRKFQSKKRGGSTVLWKKMTSSDVLIRAILKNFDFLFNILPTKGIVKAHTPKKEPVKIDRVAQAQTLKKIRLREKRRLLKTNKHPSLILAPTKRELEQFLEDF